jgi:hypothetical protein
VAESAAVWTWSWPLLLGVALSAPDVALASSCCGQAVVGDRLSEDEQAMVSLRVATRARFGSFDRRGGYAASRGVTDVSLDWIAAGVVRLTDFLELGAYVPVVLNVREAQGVDAELGGGVGDVGAFANVRLLSAFADRIAPGVVVTVGAELPTGTPPSAATLPLGADATGDGRGELQGSVILEKLYFSSLFVRLTGAAVLPLVTSSEPEARRAVRLGAALQGGAVLDPWAILAGLALEAEPGAASRRRLELSLSPLWAVSRTITLLADVRSPLPLDRFGQSDLASVRATLGVRFGVMP